MARPLVEDVPRCDLTAWVRIARGGGRGGPRHVRAQRLASDGHWRAEGLVSRGYMGDAVVWEVRGDLEVRGTVGALVVHAAEGSHRVELEAQPRHLGGVRWMAVCPSCSRRCSVLFAVGVVVCRRCAGLGYKSEVLPDREQALRMFQKIGRARRFGEG